MKYWLSLLASLFIAAPALATTVIYDGHGYLGSDTRITYVDEHDKPCGFGLANKIYKIGDLWIGAAGETKAIFHFLEWLKGKQAYPLTQQFACIVIKNRKAYIYTGESVTPRVTSGPCAVGSGGPFAMYAYNVPGTSLEEAIEFAEAEDQFSGGPIVIVRTY